MTASVSAALFVQSDTVKGLARLGQWLPIENPSVHAQVEPITFSWGEQKCRRISAWPRRKSVAQEPLPDGGTAEFRTRPPERPGDWYHNGSTIADIDRYHLPASVEESVTVAGRQPDAVTGTRTQWAPVAPCRSVHAPPHFPARVQAYAGYRRLNRLGASGTQADHARLSALPIECH
jgi:hypothetical protein